MACFGVVTLPYGASYRRHPPMVCPTVLALSGYLYSSCIRPALSLSLSLWLLYMVYHPISSNLLLLLYLSNIYLSLLCDFSNVINGITSFHRSYHMGNRYKPLP